MKVDKNGNITLHPIIGQPEVINHKIVRVQKPFTFNINEWNCYEVEFLADCEGTMRISFVPTAAGKSKKEKD